MGIVIRDLGPISDEEIENFKPYLNRPKCEYPNHLGSRYELKDGYGIFLTYACEFCEQEKLREFRPDIFELYEVDEDV